MATAATVTPVEVQKIGVTRDLTQHFLRSRAVSHPSATVGRYQPASYGGAPSGSTGSDNRPLIGTDGSSAWEGLPPAYTTAVQAINEYVRTIETKMVRLEQLHNQRLRVTMDEEKSHADEREIEIVTGEITATFGHAGRQCKLLKAPDNASQAELQILQNLQRSHAAKLNELSGRFRQSQKKYMAKLQGRRRGDTLSLFGESSTPNTEVDTGFTGAQLEMVDNLEAETNARTQEILAIAKSVEDLATIFKELAVLVIDQGTVLDRIDYNMEQTVERVQKGVDELQKGEEYSKKSLRAMICIGVLLLMIIVMVVILILKHS